MSKEIIDNIYDALAGPYWKIDPAQAKGLREYSRQAADIEEHLPTLKEYASHCNTVLELGMRACVSTWAMLSGLAGPDPGRDADVSHPIYVGCDLNFHPMIDVARKAAADENIGFAFVQGDDLEQDFIPFFPAGRVDLLFIDSWHVYGQLKRELTKFAGMVDKYILFHDTTVDAELGESLRMGWDVEKQAAEKGWDVLEVGTGLWPAIEEFLADNPQWELKERFTNCNGLTVLERVHENE